MKAKREVIEGLLRQAMVMLVINARAPGVSVPEGYAGTDGTIGLNFSHRFPSELAINETGIRQDLSFHGVWHTVRVPWAAVLAAIDHKTRKAIAFSERPEPEAPPRPRFRAIKGGLS